MPSGLLIDLRDGGPAMEITAGLRCPSYCGYSAGSNGYGSTIPIPGYVSDSVAVFSPHVTANIVPGGTVLVPDIDVMTGVTQSGSNLVFSFWSNYNAKSITYKGNIWQIFPASQSSNVGLYISDSTDFTTISNGSIVGQCIYRGRVTINGSWSPPSVAGFNRQSYAVFGKWSEAGVVVEYDGNVIRAVQERNGANVNASVTMDVVIFATGSAPVPGDGLNFFNSAGQCTFSTTRRPFVYSNSYYRPSGSGVDIGEKYILLGRYGAQTDISGGWCYAKYQGLVRSGNVVRVGRGYVAAIWTSEYPVNFNKTAGVNVLLLNDMY